MTNVGNRSYSLQDSTLYKPKQFDVENIFVQIQDFPKKIFQNSFSLLL